MKVEYKELEIEKLSNSDLIFLKKGNFWFFLSQNIKSRYFGGFFRKNKKVYRFLDDLIFYQKIEKIQILNEFKVILWFKNNKCQISLEDNALNIIFLKNENLDINFDIKEIFDNEPFKRKVLIKKLNPSTFLIKQYLDNKNIFNLIIKVYGQAKEFNSWQEKFYNFDKNRNSPPYNWWIYKGLKIFAQKIKIKILNEKNNINTLEISKEKSETLNSQNKTIIDFILRRILNLQLDNYLPAGFPWFFEHWYRDEILSLHLIKRFISQNFFQEKINFYLNNLDFIFLSNKEENSVLTSDTFLLLIEILDKKNLILHFNSLEKYFVEWQKTFIKDNNFNLPPYSTWMDSIFKKQSLEISVLYFKILTKFSKINNRYKKLSLEIKKNIKNFIKINPKDINLILVYLFTKNLFQIQEWEVLFENLLKSHYLNWGGISTLNIDSPMFQPEDKGELNIAYHQGDSWYYLNNLLAYCLLEINPKKFEKIIKKIVYSSLIDLLEDGVLGYSSEISSAKERKSEGCLAQTWSMASLLFLLSFFQNIDIFLKS